MERPSEQLVVLVGALNQKVRDGWMMTSLFHINHRAILANSLVSLTENRVQWLLENLLLVEEGHVVGHEQLHTLHWVLNRSSLVQVNDHGALESWHQL